MSDNVPITAGSGTNIGADEVASVKYQRIKLIHGADGVNDGDVATGNPLPVVQTGTPSLPTGAATAVNQQTNALTNTELRATAVPVSGTLTANIGSVSTLSTATKQDTGNTSLASIDGKITAVNTGAVTVASSALPSGAATSAKQDTGNTSIGSVDTNVGAIADASVAAGATGSVHAKLRRLSADVDSVKTNTANIPAVGQALAAASTPVVLTAAQITTLTPPAAITGFATAAKQPALGTAGTASADVITVQGKASMTPLLIDGSATTQPVSGTVAVTGVATSTKQSDGSQKTQIVDGSGNVIGATSNAIDVNIKSGSSAGTQYTEDAASAGGETGTVILGVRKDADTSPVSADGDFHTAIFDNAGNLKVNVKTGGTAGTQYTEDAAAAADPVGNMLMGRRKDTLSTSEVSADGDNIALNATNKGQLHVKLADTVTVDNSGVTQPVSGTVTINAIPAGNNNIGDVDVATLPVAFNTGVRSATTQRVTIATDDSVPVTGTFWQATQPVSVATVPSHAVTNAGTFAVQATEADGANTTLGAKADAKSTATDTTSISAMSVLKQISASVQAPPSQAVTNAGTFAVQSVDAGDVAHDGADSGNPVKVGGKATNVEPTAVSASGDRTNLITDMVGKLITLPYSNPENFVSGAITSAMTGTTSTSLVAAPAAGLRNYLTTIIVSNAHATVGTDIVIQDGSGGTTLLTIPAAAVYGGAVITLPTPLRQPTTATAIYCANVTTGASTKASAVGYKGV